MFKCSVTTKDGDTWCFCVPDFTSFCMKIYEYFRDKCEVFDVKVERMK